jgi:hypothetical protein
MKEKITIQINNILGKILSEYKLRSADLNSAKNISKIFQSPLSILKSQKGKLRAFKYLSKYGFSPYKNMNYIVGETYIEENCNTNEMQECGKGLSIATLDWCLRDSCCDLSKIYIEVEFDAKDIVAIPYVSDGKFRVRKLKVIRKLSKEELENYLKINKRVEGEEV